MSSPTIIRHTSFEGTTALVATYFEKTLGHTTLMAAFQVYETGLGNNQTHMVWSSPWTTEIGAVKEFNQWVKDNVK